MKKSQFTLNSNHKPYIIAEMACSHEGRSDLAQKIIASAGLAGANAIQFQVWILKKMPELHNSKYKKLKYSNYD